MPNDSSILPDHLRQARRTARLSQLELALRLGVSQRHVSFVEGGRAKPSRELLANWLQALDVPLLHRNQAMLSAGFAPMYGQRNLHDPALTSAQLALQQLLATHDPMPAFVMDAQWNVLQLNRGARWLAATLMPDAAALSAPATFNLLDALLAPNGIATAMTNFAEAGAALLARLRAEANAEPALRPRVAALARLLQQLSARPLITASYPPLLTSSYQTAFGTLSFFSMFTTFGTPHDIHLASLRVEHLFAADAHTKAVLATKV